MMIWITFGMNPLKAKWLPQPLKKIDMVVVGVIFFYLFLDIDGQSLRLRGHAINWWLFYHLMICHQGNELYSLISSYQQDITRGGGGGGGGGRCGRSEIQLLLKSWLMNFVNFLQTWLLCLGKSSHTYFWHQAISGHFPRWPPKKLVSRITYEPLVGLHSNLVWLFSRYFWWSG